MGGVDAWLWLLGRATHEITLFAAVGLLVGGIDDLLIDVIWIARSAWRRATVYRRHAAADAGTLRPATAPGRIAVFVGAWDEAPVIGAMLRTTLERFGDADYRIFVGLYPNDPATMNIVRRVQGDDPRGDRLHLVVGTVNGPTTKAENLNRLWEALQREEQASGIRVKAVVLHDAEDVVHPAELRVFDRLIERFDLVQLPVLPLVTPGSPWFRRIIATSSRMHTASSSLCARRWARRCRWPAPAARWHVTCCSVYRTPMAAGRSMPPASPRITS